MHSVKGKWLRGIAIGISDVIVPSLVIDISDVIRCLIVNCQNRTPNSMRDGKI